MRRLALKNRFLPGSAAATGDGGHYQAACATIDGPTLVANLDQAVIRQFPWLFANLAEAGHHLAPLKCCLLLKILPQSPVKVSRLSDSRQKSEVGQPDGHATLTAAEGTGTGRKWGMVRWPPPPWFFDLFLVA